MHRVQGTVRGRVQGVGFRYFVLQHAQTAGLVGYVRNLPNGRVEFLLEGDPEQVQTVVEQIHRGPGYSKVDAVDLVEPDSTERFVEFVIRR